MVLRMLSEEVTWTGEGCSQSEAPDSRRALLSTLVETLDTALPYLHSCLEKHFVQAAQAATENEQQAAKAHTAAVRAALGKLMNALHRICLCTDIAPLFSQQSAVFMMMWTQERMQNDSWKL